MEDPVSGRRGSTPNFDDVGKMMEDYFYQNESIVSEKCDIFNVEYYS